MSVLLTQRHKSDLGPSTRSSHGFGQGKRACTILASEGDLVHVITDVPYMTRSRHKPAAYYKGSRPMHRTTLRIPTQSYSSYATTSNHVSNVVICTWSIIKPV